MNLVEEILAHIWRTVLKEEEPLQLPFQQMSYEEATNSVCHCIKKITSEQSFFLSTVPINPI